MYQNPAYNSQQPVRTSIFYFNDYHGNYSKMGSLKTASDRFSQSRQGVDSFKLTAGDVIKGSNLEQDAMWVEFLNQLGVDASAIGNHELDQGTQNFNQNILKANYKYVSSNIAVNPSGNLAESLNSGKLVKSLIINKNGHLYGILGLTPDDAKYLKPGGVLNNNDISSLDVKTTLKELQSEVNRLQKSGVNKIILLSHFDDDDNKIPANVLGIDVIISGHKHRVYQGLAPQKNLFYAPNGEPVLKVEGGKDGKYHGTLDLTFDKDGKIIAANNQLVENKDIPPDLSIIALKQKYKLYKNPIGMLESNLSNEIFPENPLGDMIADAVREKSGADIAVVAPGNISAGLDSGILCESDIKNVLPYKNKVIKAQISEKDLVDALKYFIPPEKDDHTEARLLQVSGLRYTIGPDNSLQEANFVSKDGKLTAINVINPDPNKSYTVAMGESLLKKGDRFNYTLLERYDWDVADATIEKIKSRHFIPFYVRPNGRIKNVNTPQDNLNQPYRVQR